MVKILKMITKLNLCVIIINYITNNYLIILQKYTHKST